MDALYEFLLSYGYVGMMISAFMAGTVFPFNSELIMMGLAATGLDPWKLIIWGTIGNTAGGMTNYAIGLLGKAEWLVKYFHIKKDRLEKMQCFRYAESQSLAYPFSHGFRKRYTIYSVCICTRIILNDI